MAIFYHNPFVHSFVLCCLDLIFQHKLAIFHHNPSVHSFVLCGLDLIFQNKMAFFYHSPYVHSFVLCVLILVFRHKMAIFDHNPFVHNFCMVSNMNNFVSYISIDINDCLIREKNVVLIKILTNKMEFSGFLA